MRQHINPIKTGTSTTDQLLLQTVGDTHSYLILDEGRMLKDLLNK